MTYPEGKIKSVKNFVETIMQMRSEPDYQPIYGEQWFFRGQANSKWDIRPSTFRDDSIAFEHKIIERAQRYNPQEFRDCSNKLELLTKLQHYGLGTRLLDLTLNPLVALYFAVQESKSYRKNKNGTHTLINHSGRVSYAFRRGLSLNDIEARIPLELPFMEFTENSTLGDFCRQLRDQRTISPTEYKNITEDDYEKAISLLQTNSFIVSTNSNARLIQQQGAFLLSPSINLSSSAATEQSSLSKAKADLTKEFNGSFVIDSKDKQAIREELDFFNVNEATLFPELEHQMNYLQERTTVPVGTVDTYVRYVRVLSEMPRVASEKSPEEILRIVQTSLPDLNKNVHFLIQKTIISKIEVLDWQLKDSVISSMRRLVAKELQEFLPEENAKDKANEIVDKMLM